jgi:signal transduction histidine kinase
MSIEKKLFVLIISIVGLFSGLGCTQKKATALPNSHASVVIDPSFTSQSINEQVLVSTKFSEKELSRQDLKKWFSENTEKVSQKKDVILIGNFRKYPKAWFYTQIINTTNVNQVLVADEFNRLRCDAFELYTIDDDGIKKRGSLNRGTPFSQYPIPFFTYALPFTIQPKDTLHLLIHTQRHFGVHEVNLNVYNYENYLNTTFTIFLTKVFQITIFMILGITMIILGQVFRYRSMTYWGIEILALVCIHITTWGFVDPFINFPNIGLSGSNVSVFGMMVGITPPLFILEWMKPIPKDEKIFKTLTYSLFGISLFFTVCYLFPKPLFNLIYDTVNLSLMMIVLTMLNTLQLFFYALLAWIRSKIYYLFIGLFVSYAPFILSQTTLFSEDTNVFLKSDSVIFIFMTIGTLYVGVNLLRTQFVTRKNLEENLVELKETLEDIRKTEVEAIGRNLHDNVGNILASAVGYLHLRNPNTETSENLIKDAIQEIRFLSHNLVKNEDAPLVYKIESLISRFNDFSAIRFYFNDYSEGKINLLDKITQQNIYMIIQEALTNIIKHSKAKSVFIQIFKQQNDTFQIILEDDGIGFNDFADGNGIGLKNIKKRAEISKLNLTVDSTNAGTNFIIETPKQK